MQTYWRVKIINKCDPAIRSWAWEETVRSTCALVRRGSEAPPHRGCDGHRAPPIRASESSLALVVLSA